MANPDAACSICYSHIQQRRLVKHGDVAVINRDVPLRGVYIRLVAGQHLSAIARNVDMGPVLVGGVHVGDVDGHVVVQDRCAPDWATHVPSHISALGCHVMQPT